MNWPPAAESAESTCKNTHFFTRRCGLMIFSDFFFSSSTKVPI